MGRIIGDGVTRAPALALVAIGAALVVLAVVLDRSGLRAELDHDRPSGSEPDHRVAEAASAA